jgi:hypothetical protein
MPARVQRLAIELPELGATVLVFLPVPPSLLLQLPEQLEGGGGRRQPPPMSCVEVRPVGELEQEQGEAHVEAGRQQQQQQQQEERGQQRETPPAMSSRGSSWEGGREGSEPGPTA